MVTRAEADAIIQEGKVIGANLSWKPDRRSFRLEAMVLTIDSGQLLKLRGYIGLKNRSFALLHKNVPIRMYTVHDRHRNPLTGEIVRVPHKHYWDDVWEDDLIEIPSDIRSGDPNTEFMDFLAECNITLHGGYNALLC